MKPLETSSREILPFKDYEILVVQKATGSTKHGDLSEEGDGFGLTDVEVKEFILKLLRISLEWLAEILKLLSIKQTTSNRINFSELTDEHILVNCMLGICFVSDNQMNKWVLLWLSFQGMKPSCLKLEIV